MILASLTGVELKALKEKVKQLDKSFNDTIDVPGVVKFGCEIEFSSLKGLNYYRKRIKDKDYSVKLDGSGPDIVEVTTPILYNEKEYWQDFRNNLTRIKHGMITPSTGGHIHFDHSILDDENIITFLKLWYVAEDIIYEYATGEFEHLRKGAELYAEKLDQKLKKRISEYEKGKLELSEFAYFDKCYGLNLYNHLSSHHAYLIAIDTYEVRVPNGTLDIATWQNNVEFFASLFLYADSKKSKPVIEKLYKNGKLEVNYENLLLLSDLIFRSDAAKYRFLNQFHEKKQFNGHPTKKRWF